MLKLLGRGAILFGLQAKLLLPEYGFGAGVLPHELTESPSHFCCFIRLLNSNGATLILYKIIGILNSPDIV